VAELAVKPVFHAARTGDESGVFVTLGANPGEAKVKLVTFAKHGSGIV
jgi:hypothetical protein